MRRQAPGVSPASPSTEVAARLRLPLRIGTIGNDDEAHGAGRERRLHDAHVDVQPRPPLPDSATTHVPCTSVPARGSEGMVNAAGQ